MAMPRGDSPQKAQEFYHYLLAHHETEHRVKTWSVDWLSLAWLWGFVVALSVILLWWIWQYRTTRHKMGVYPVDSWSGFTTELAGPASFFFVLFPIGHLVNGQMF
jgi:hypothetical protein